MIEFFQIVHKILFEAWKRSCTSQTFHPADHSIVLSTKGISLVLTPQHELYIIQNCTHKTDVGVKCEFLFPIRYDTFI